MPSFEVISLNDARLELSLTGARGALIRQYLDYLKEIEPNQAGKLTAKQGETTAAIRRRLAAAADLMGKTLEMERQGDTVFFWEKNEDDPPRKRRRRRRRNADADESPNTEEQE